MALRVPRSVAAAATAAALLLSAGAVPRAEISRAQEIRARVFKLLNDGIQAYKEGRPKDAVTFLEEAAATALNSFRAYYYLGLAYKADRQYRRAIEPLQVALELEPADMQAHVALGDCYLRLGDPAEALAEYHRALAVQADYAPAFDGLGRAAEASGDDEKAIEHYRKAISLNPGFPDPSLNLGDLYLREGRYNEAIELFLKAIKVRPDFAAAFNRLGTAYAHERLSNEAIAALRQAASLERGNPWHPVTIGRIFLDLDSLAQAALEFDAALALDADYLEAYLAKAALRRRQGRFQEAVDLLDAGLGRDADDPRAKARMVELRGRIEEEGRRAAELEARLAEDAADPRALARLADLKAELGDHAAAAGLYRRAAAAPGVPAGADLLARLGYSALRAEMYEEAVAAYESLAQAAPRDPAILINLGLARMGGGDGAGAEAALKEASRLRPGDVRPLGYLANLYAVTAQPARAIETLNAALAAAGDAEGAATAERQRLLRLLRALQSGTTAPAGPPQRGAP